MKKFEKIEWKNYGKVCAPIDHLLYGLVPDFDWKKASDNDELDLFIEKLEKLEKLENGEHLIALDHHVNWNNYLDCGELDIQEAYLVDGEVASTLLSETDLLILLDVDLARKLNKTDGCYWVPISSNMITGRYKFDYFKQRFTLHN